jgi:hypothetical protein
MKFSSLEIERTVRKSSKRFLIIGIKFGDALDNKFKRKIKTFRKSISQQIRFYVVIVNQKTFFSKNYQEGLKEKILNKQPYAAFFIPDNSNYLLELESKAILEKLTGLGYRKYEELFGKIYDNECYYINWNLPSIEEEYYRVIEKSNTNINTEDDSAFWL